MAGYQVGSAGSDCQTQIFDDEVAAQGAFIDLLVRQVRSALASPKQDLAVARRQVELALRLSGSGPNLLRQRDLNHLFSDVAYRQARNTLSDVENRLRSAIADLRLVEKKAPGRYEDTDRWLEHLEQVLQSVAPAPPDTTPFASQPPIRPAPRIQGTPPTLPQAP